MPEDLRNKSNLESSIDGALELFVAEVLRLRLESLSLLNLCSYHVGQVVVKVDFWDIVDKPEDIHICFHDIALAVFLHLVEEIFVGGLRHCVRLEAVVSWVSKRNV